VAPASSSAASMAARRGDVYEYMAFLYLSNGAIITGAANAKTRRQD